MLWDVGLEDEHLQRLLDAPITSGLERLVCETAVTEEGLAALGCWPGGDRLTSLEIDGATRELLGGSINSLERLRVMSPDDAIFKDCGDRLRRLRMLSIEGASLADDLLDEMIAAISGATNLRELDLSYGVVEGAASRLAESGVLDRLEVLMINGSDELGDSGLSRFARRGWPGGSTRTRRWRLRAW